MSSLNHTIRSEILIRENQEEIMRHLYPGFYALVAPRSARKKRRCLKCSKVFVSAHKGNRCCAECVDSNKRTSVMGQEIA